MKICFISAHSFVRPGGVRTHILNLSRELESLGHETHIVAPKNGSTTAFNSNIKNLTEIGFTIPLPSNGSYVDISLFTSSELEDYLNEQNFDVLHFHNFTPFLSSDALYLSKGCKKIMTVHTFPTGMIKRFVNAQTAADFLRMYDHAIFVSKSQSDLFSKVTIPYSIIPNGIKIDQNAKVKSIDESKPIKILYVGRIEPRKGLNYLIEAYAEVLNKTDKKVELHVVGSGNFDFVSKIYAGLLKENVTFHGSLSDSELEKMRNSADIYVSPATHGESFGLVLLEAMTKGVPTLAFDNPGYRSVLEDELNWCLVENKNTSELSLKILELINNPTLYKEISAKSISEAAKYDWTKITKDILEIYKNIPS